MRWPRPKTRKKRAIKRTESLEMRWPRPETRKKRAFTRLARRLNTLNYSLRPKHLSTYCLSYGGQNWYEIRKVY